jgi:tetratricopeptide (TPR) repeat protein
VVLSGVNLSRAIACYEAALSMYTEDSFPMDWAMTQNNLGIAYKNLPSGDHDINLNRAIACYEASLRVRTEENFPMDWAMTQGNIAFLEKDRGEVEQAQIRIKLARDMFQRCGAIHDAEKASRILQAWSQEI